MKNNIHIENLGVVITKQGRRFVAYSPALDVSTSGKTLKAVQANFVELATIFLEEIMRAGTAQEVLSEPGSNRAHKKWSPPQIISSESIDIRMPAFA